MALAALAGGLLTGQRSLLIFGASFLGEELYETGFLILVLRESEKAQAAVGGSVAMARQSAPGDG